MRIFCEMINRGTAIKKTLFVKIQPLVYVSRFEEGVKTFIKLSDLPKDFCIFYIPRALSMLEIKILKWRHISSLSSGTQTIHNIILLPQ